MPELPDIALYLEALAARVVGQPILKLRIGNPFVVRTIEPPPSDLAGREVLGLRRLGKRIVFVLSDEFFIVVHLMIAGRLRWRDAGAAIPGKVGLAAFDFPSGTVIFTEAGSKRQASIHIVRGEAALAALDPQGLEVLDADLPTFASRLRQENHTLKRALTDPHIFSGIGNAYSDEILHAARLSPMKTVAALSDDEVARLFAATRATLEAWIATPARGSGWRVPREGHRVPSRDGGSRPLRPALPGLRVPRAADCLHAERGQLLQPLSDRRTAPLRSRVVALAQGGLAPHARGARVAQIAAARLTVTHMTGLCRVHVMNKY